MDIPQLKLLAARIRELLKEASCLVGHSQSLDLVAALPGLRNWPEVNAFPDRVAACQLDLAATGRLAFRLKRKFDLDRSAQQLLDALRPGGSQGGHGVLNVWPGGPPAGVYLTTSADSIQALLARYEEATDGGVVYAERAAAHHPGAIDLGDYGLWSNGLDRVPSGTLLVLGPIEVDQGSWEDAGKRIEMGCLRAYSERHRVAVLIDTPTPETLFEDARLMVQMAAENSDQTENDAEIVGAVDNEGNLVRQPAPAYLPAQRPPRIAMSATLDALPPAAVDPLRRALAARRTGLLLFGHSDIHDQAAAHLVAASLALTEFAGPAARIMPRHRSTPAKDWQVPEPIKALPFLPSVHSAYAQGYRRIVIDSRHMKAEMLLPYPDVLFIGGSFGHEVCDVARIVLLSALDGDRLALSASLIASLGVLEVPTKRAPVIAPDLVVLPTPPETLPPGMPFSEFEEYLLGHRQLRWEDTIEQLLRTRACTVAELKQALPRNQRLANFLSARRKATMAKAT